MVGMLIVVYGGHLGADLFGFGSAEFGEQGEGLLPVTTGLAEVAVGVARLAEAVVGAGLLVLVAGLGSEVQRGGVLGAGVVGLASGNQHLAEAVERVSLAGLVADLPEQSPRFPQVPGGLI
jgi:hypothetical protein